MSKFDPYETLGLKKEASKDDVRKAYRRRARSTHPDAGGSREEFDRVTRAHLLLTDDSRRARYDSTGDATEAEPDNAEAAAIQVIVALIDTHIQKLIAHGQNVNLGDPQVLACHLVTEQIQKIRGDMGKYNSLHTGLMRAARMKRRKKGPALLIKALQHRANEIKAESAKVEKALKSHTDALAMLQEYQFDEIMETAPQVQFRSFFMR